MAEVVEIPAHRSERYTSIIVEPTPATATRQCRAHRREFERAGVAAIQIEDQEWPKRCGHMDGKALISTAEMWARSMPRSMRAHAETLIIARTDASWSRGWSRAIDAQRGYREAGADMLSSKHRGVDDGADRASALGARIPLMANMVEGGVTPVLAAAKCKL